MRDPRVPRGEPREGAGGKGGIGWHGMGEDAVQAWSGATGEAHRRRELKGPRSEVGWCHQHARATPKGARSTGSTATLSSSPYSPTLLSDPLVAWLKDMASTSPYVSAPASAPSQLVETLGKLTASLPELPQVEWTYKTIATSVLAVVVTLLLAEQALWRSRKQTLPGHAWQIVSARPPPLSLVVRGPLTFPHPLPVHVHSPSSDSLPSRSTRRWRRTSAVR